MNYKLALTNLSSDDGFVFFAIVFLIAFIGFALVRRFVRVSFSLFLLILVGLILGLAAGSLVGGFFEDFPGGVGQWLSPIAQAFVVFVVLDFFWAQRTRLVSFNDSLRPIVKRLLRPLQIEGMSQGGVVVDSSALVDGRLSELVRTGFLSRTLVVPQVVLEELQRLADQGDSLKRARGRLGLDVVASLQKNPQATVVIVESSLKAKEGVDSHLIRLAKTRRASVLTLDYNLNKVASIAGVKVLNLNELVGALRPNVLPGERLMVNVIQKGKERGQGVGFLPDGTMIVVEGGSKYVGQQVECTVERMFQTVAGKMIFGQPVK